jgi:tRNA-2-methylthio-N6-dimethylallyladenosine synthase
MPQFMNKTFDKQYHIWTIGCQMNEADSRKLGAQLETLGYGPTPDPDEADVVVLNTCVVRQQAENKIYGRLGSLKTIKQRRPDLVLGLMGCLVGVKEAPALQEKFPFVDVFMSPSDGGPLLDYLQEHDLYEAVLLQEQSTRSLQDAIQDAENVLPIDQRGVAVTAHVPVVLGCSHACTFCIIPYRRGGERSRPSTDVLHEIELLAGQGIREIMLLGQIVDRYGLDLDEDIDLAELLARANKIDGIHRIRFLTSHPNWMTDKLLDAVSELDKVCPHLEVPVQAGNDEVLANMRRGYTSDDYYRLVDRIRERLPQAALNTDIIVGFPGETDEQFMDTYRMMQRVQFDKVHISTYSPRPKTVSVRKMPDNVTIAEKKHRRQMLDDLQKEVLTAKNARYQNTFVEVLVEKHQKERWFGRTPDNRLVYFEGGEDLIGQLVTVQIDWVGPYSLIGQKRQHANAEVLAV